MNRKIVLGGSVLLVLAFGVVLFARHVRRANEADARTRPSGDVDLARRLESVPVAEPRSSVRENLPTTAPPDAAPPSAEADATVVRARFVDEHGAPVSGVTLFTLGETARVARSASDGEAKLALERSDGAPAGPTTFEARCPGYATEQRTATVVPGRVLQLGDWRLVAGGTVEGLVVDADGDGIGGVGVACLSETLAESDVERQPRSALAELARPGARATSDRDGAFRLLDVPAGRIRLVAVVDERSAAVSEPVDVPPGGLARGVLVRMGAADGGTTITGIVLDPAGRPVGRASLTVRSAGTLDSFAAEHDGRFAFRCTDDAPRDVIAVDPEQHFREATRLGVRPGTAGLELRLARAPGIRLTVRSRIDAPIERFAVAVIAEQDARVLVFAAEDERPGGAFTLAAPAQDFRVEVRANGWLPARLGPFSPAALPERLECRLDPAGGVRGVVSAGGKPLAGASVALHEEAHTRVTYNGFPLRMRPEAVRERETDAAGAFALSVESAGRYYLRVEHEDYAPAEVGPLLLAPDERHEECVELGAGGTLSVRVRSATGVSVAGSLVALSRGDGKAWTERTGEDGSVEIPFLAPGDWQVELTKGEIDPRYGATYESAQPAGTVPTNCRVIAGEVTRVDLWLEERDDDPCRLAGRLTIDGAPAEGFVAALERAGEDVGAPQPFVEPGMFRLGADEPGPYRLRLMRMSGGPQAMLMIRDSVELFEGERHWSLELASATLTGRIATPDESALVFYRWQRGTLECVVPLVPDAEGRFRCEGIPAGRGAFVRADPSRPLEEQTPVVLREVEVAPGETASVDL